MSIVSTIKKIIHNIISYFQKKGAANHFTEDELSVHSEKVTALHEAAHAVTTHISKFHSLIDDVSIFSATTGETFISLSKTKLISQGKSLLHTMKDDEVVEDRAIIMYAGLEAEKIYCEKYKGVPLDINYSANDYGIVDEVVSHCSNPSIDKKQLIFKSRDAVIMQFDKIRELADCLIKSPTKSIDLLLLTDALNASFKSNIK